MDDIDGLLHRGEPFLVQHEVARARLPLLAEQHVALPQERQSDHVLGVIVNGCLAGGRNLPDRLREQRVHGRQLVRLQPVPQRLLRHGRVQTLHVVRGAYGVVQLGIRREVIDIGERVVPRLQAKVIAPVRPDRHVERRFRVDEDRGPLRVQEISLEHVPERVFADVARDERAQVEAAALQGVGHVLNLAAAVPVAPFRRPIEAIFRVVMGAQALPGDVVAVHVRVFGVGEVQAGLLEPLQANRVLPLVVGEAREDARVGGYPFAQPSRYHLDPRAAVHVHHPLVLIESGKCWCTVVFVRVKNFELFDNVPKFVEIGPLEHVLSVINVRESHEENDAEEQYPDESAEAGNDN